MLARTILLPKGEGVGSMNHIRPITILGVLYRLVGKLVFRKVSAVWAQELPSSISGGLPGRGVKDLALEQKLAIESKFGNNESIGGFSLDLQKAFNTFPRRPFVRLMSRLGVPDWLTVWWIKCLSEMRRCPQYAGLLGQPTWSSTGLPEGDSLSVLGMLALSTLFHFVIKQRDIVPYTYADNWAWRSLSCRSRFHAFQRMLALAHLLRVLVDIAKSWHWSNNKEWRRQFQYARLFIPSKHPDIPILSSVKDLGEMMLYNKVHRLGFLKCKFAEASKRIRRVSHLPLSLQSKRKLILTSAWPLAFYAADSTYVGHKHIQDLRRCATESIVGKGHYASSWLAMHSLSRFLVDPLLYIFASICRLFRRFASHNAERLHRLLLSNDQFRPNQSFGPLSTLCRYCDQLGWVLHPTGTLTHAGGFEFSLFTHSSKQIITILQRWWPSFMITQCDRKGTDGFIPHVTITRSVFQSFSCTDQKLLMRNMLGGFQTGKTKSLWDSDSQHTCKLCGEVENRRHNFLECRHLQAVRESHVEAVSILVDTRPNWIYLPVAHEHEDVQTFRQVMQRMEPPLPVPAVKPQPSPPVVTFFTDGGAINPCDPSARLAAWTFVQDVSNDSNSFTTTHAFAFCQPPKFPNFHVLMNAPELFL